MDWYRLPRPLVEAGIAPAARAEDLTARMLADDSVQAAWEFGPLKPGPKLGAWVQDFDAAKDSPHQE